MKRKPEFSLTKIAIFSEIALFLFGFIGLAKSVSFDSINSPWQTINPIYLYLFFVATILLGFIIAFGNQSNQVSLALISGYSLMMFAYLPMTHPLLYGADGWRHLGDVNRILVGGPWRQVVPGAGGLLTWFGQLSYTGFWLIIALVSKLPIITSLSAMRWFQPVVAAVALPTLVFLLAQAIGLGRRLSLLTAWFIHFPFAIQALGAFTLPVNLWFLVFLGATIVLIKQYSLDLPNRLIIGILLLVLCLGYSLYPLLYLLQIGLAEVIRWYSLGKISRRMVIGYMALSALIIPILELFTNGSSIENIKNWFSQIKQLVGNLLGWYLAVGPRPHVITTGNIFLNQVPSYAFVPNLFTAWRGWLVALMVIVLVGVVVGCYRILVYGDKTPQLFAVFGITVFVSYILGRYFLVGEQIITRRLEAVIATWFVFMMIAAFEWAIEWAEGTGGNVGVVIISFVIIGSAGISASYTLGPVAQTVSFSDYVSMQRIWNAEQTFSNYCIIADTYPLLALQGISAGNIVGGGFPINSDFSQPERMAVLNNLRERGADSFVDVNYALNMTNAKHCWYQSQNGFLQKVGG